MPAIVTLTFNPAIDKSTSVEALLPDKKLRCSNPHFEPGGGGVNVARAIKKLGGDALAVYPVGGYSGHFFNELLEKESVRVQPVQIAQHTRENLVVLDKLANKQYRFGMPGPELAEGEWMELLRVIEGIPEMDYLVASGSLPTGVPVHIFGRLAAIARKKNAKYIVDTSGEALKQAVAQGVYLLKPNLGELAALAGEKWLSKEQAAAAARALIIKGGCEVLVISMGEEGALLVTRGETHSIRPPHAERKSTVGAGDSMVAGIVYSLSTGRSLLQAVQYGVACGTAATMNPGTELCRKEDADRLYGEIINQSGLR